MAYVSQELKSKLAPKIKAVLKRYNVKGTLSVNNHSTLVLTIKSGPINFIKNYNAVQDSKPDDPYGFKHIVTDHIDVNPYHFDKHFTGVARAFLSEVYEAMMEGNWDNSDPQTDYFSVGWYCSIHIGKWNRPYQLTGMEE